MLVTGSFTGLIRTLLLLIGGVVVLRFFGRLIRAKNAMEEERNILKKQNDFQKEREQKLKNFGKTTVISNPKKQNNTEDVDFVDLKD